MIRVADGILLRVDAAEVGRVIEPSADERAYANLLPNMPATADGHATMAKWCQEHELLDQKNFHWEHVLRHDPDHADARRALGYSLIRGRWTRAEDFMEAQGYVRHRGAWRLPQQVAVEQRQQEIEVAEKLWRRDIETWRNWLDGRRHDEGLRNLESIDDPLADVGLAELLVQEEDAGVRLLYVDLLARLATPTAINALVSAAIEDPDVDVRLKSIDYVRERDVIRGLMAWTTALRSPDNLTVNRAGVALGRAGHPDAVRPLINALVTTHVSVTAPPPGNIRPSFGANADGSGGFNGLSVGGGPKKVKHNIKNKSVLEALVSLTGKNYRYSPSEWNQWYIQQRSLSDDVNLRRD